jgi:hypothetical protein
MICESTLSKFVLPVVMATAMLTLGVPASEA